MVYIIHIILTPTPSLLYTIGENWVTTSQYSVTNYFKKSQTLIIVRNFTNLVGSYSRLKSKLDLNYRDADQTLYLWAPCGVYQYHRSPNIHIRTIYFSSAFSAPNNLLHLLIETLKKDLFLNQLFFYW
jgi:hypothetical protein